VTDVVLPPLPTAVPELLADEADLHGCAAALRAASAQVDDLGTFVAGRARLADWYGVAATSYRGTIAPIGRRADAMSLALRAVARRVDVHADELGRLRRRRDDLVAECASLAQGIASVRDRAPGAVGPEHALLVREAQALHGRAAAYARDLTAWTDAVEAEELAMVSVFERLLTPEQVEDRYGGVADPADDALASLPGPGADPGDLRDWWHGLTRAQQLAVVVAAPGAIGNRDGIPARARHAANTIALDRDLADPTCPWRENARAADRARREIAGRTDPVTGEPVPAQVLIYDPGAFDGEGRVAIAAGDLDTADNVAVLVPGLDTTAQSAETYAERAGTLHEAARVLGPDQTNATLFWIGYDAPDITEVVSEDSAAAGGARLADTIDGLRASRVVPAHLTAIGYSYGSTTLGHGAHDHGLAADDLVVVGSPGLGGDTDSAADLGIDPHHVWAGANSHDPIALLGNDGSVHLELLGGLGLGDDPVEDDFGANRFTAESVTRDEDTPLESHVKYFEHDTESLANMTRIVIGDYGEVRHADHVHDPWYSGPQDPEGRRQPTAPDTDGRP